MCWVSEAGVAEQDQGLIEEPPLCFFRVTLGTSPW